MLIDELHKRKRDIDSFYSLLRLIDQCDSHTAPLLALDEHNRIVVDDVMQKCMKANAIILLYNSIESTFSECILSVYDAIHDGGLQYGDLSDKMKKVWVDGHFKQEVMQVAGARKTAKSISDCVLNNTIVELKEYPSSISGNLDVRKILAISKALGVSFGKIPNVNDTKTALFEIKESRNALAHGRKSFGDVGALLVMSDLEKYRNLVICFLDHMVVVFEGFIQTKGYHA